MSLTNLVTVSESLIARTLFQHMYRSSGGKHQLEMEEIVQFYPKVSLFTGNNTILASFGERSANEKEQI